MNRRKFLEATVMFVAFCATKTKAARIAVTPSRPACGCGRAIERGSRARMLTGLDQSPEDALCLWCLWRAHREDVTDDDA
jgi:hypothetical protein